MNIQEDVVTKLGKLSDLFSDSSKIKVLHFNSTEEPLSYYFISLAIDLENKQTYLGGKSFMEIMLDILKEKYDNTRQIELEYQGTIDKLDDYRPSGMNFLESILLNPYRQGERDDTRSHYAYKHYVRNCFYDWMHEVDWEGRTDIIKVSDVSFTPKKSLKTLLEVSGFSKDIIPYVHIVRSVRQPVGSTIIYVGA